MDASAPWLLLAGVALGTSTVSAVVGMAGGILLLTVLLLYLDPLTAIPLHGVVQLVSNLSRAQLQRRHVQWRLVARFAWLLLPAGALGLLLAQRIPTGSARLGIAGFVLCATWAPRALRLAPPHSRSDPARRFVLAGALIGFANVLVGATGPLLAPFFLALAISREAVIGTLAACQTLGHLAKVALFGASGFAFTGYALPLLALCVASIAGSALGTRLLARTDQATFRRAVRVVLTVLASRLAWQGATGA